MASKKTRRWIIVSAFAAATAAAPVIVAATLTSAEPQQQAYPGQCLAWFGNQEDGKCLGYSNGQPISGGTPWGVYGPNNYQNGVMLPGTTINRGLN
ncbi:hypothetical protein [Mycobacterium sp. 1274761.0]|uniref:DUF7155 family protein n=1 Tax=Mycobacterium sp. 1274761.0 TaxID=1834077 RepID=UPI000AB83595